MPGLWGCFDDQIRVCELAWLSGQESGLAGVHMGEVDMGDVPG